MNWQDLQDFIAEDIVKSYGIKPRNMIDLDDVCLYCHKVPPVFFQWAAEELGLIPSERSLIGWYYCPHCGALERGRYAIMQLNTGSIGAN